MSLTTKENTGNTCSFSVQPGNLALDQFLKAGQLISSSGGCSAVTMAPNDMKSSLESDQLGGVKSVSFLPIMIRSIRSLDRAAKSAIEKLTRSGKPVTVHLGLYANLDDGFESEVGIFAASAPRSPPPIAAYSRRPWPADADEQPEDDRRQVEAVFADTDESDGAASAALAAWSFATSSANDLAELRDALFMAVGQRGAWRKWTAVGHRARLARAFNARAEMFGSTP
jgi:hypothetical protein